MASRLEEHREQVVFGSRSDDRVQEEPIVVQSVEFVGSFEGQVGGRVLVITGATRAEMFVDIPGGAVLRGDLALDDRLPRATVAQLIVSVDGREVSRHDVLAGDSSPLLVSLDEWNGSGRRLSFELSAKHFEPEPVFRRVYDQARQVEVDSQFVAKMVRLGIADPRMAVSASVTRRVASAERPSILILHVETLRADVLRRLAGEVNDHVPNFRRLLSCSTVYETAVAPSSWTLPSTASLLTGLSPSSHGVVKFELSVLPDDVPTLPELAREEGIVSAAIVTNPLLRPDAGFSRGFHPYVELPYRNARQVNDLVEAFLTNHSGQQSLLFVHYYDPHHPYDAPGPWRDRFVDQPLVGLDVNEAVSRMAERVWTRQELARDDADVLFLRQRYLGEVAWFDHQLGELLAFVDAEGLAETTAVVLTSDHGEEFLEHGLLGHGSNLFDETLRVPLLVAEPGALAGWSTGDERGRARRIDAVVGGGGLFAEVLDMLGVPFRGDGVLPSLSQQASSPWPAAVSETDRGLVPGVAGRRLRRPIRAIRSDSHFLVWHKPLPEEAGDGSVCFYDLANDPGATQPLSPVGPEAERLWSALESTLGWSRGHASDVPAAGLAPDTLEAMGELGYLKAPAAVELPPCPSDG